MESWKRNIYKFGATAALVGIAFWLGGNLYQPPNKSEEIYTKALEAYNKNEFSTSYRTFSRIVFTSDLKPLAIYRQGVDAEKIDDYNAAIKQYKFFLLLYPRHQLAPRVQYNLAQVLMKTNPNEAKKNFEKIISHYPNTDFAIASEYYSGLIDLKRYEKEQIFPLSAKNDIQNHFRHYLKKAPSGRLALSVAKDWESIDVNISKDDYLLMAKSYFLFKDYQKTAELCKKAELQYAWALDVKNSAATGNAARAKYLTEWGLRGNADYVELEDVKEAIDAYMSLVPSKYQAANHLMGIAKGRGKDYVMNIKCTYSPSNEITDCYKNLYLWFPKSEYIDKAQAQIFITLVSNRDFQNAKRIGTDFLSKYKDTSDYAPMVMFYMGVLSENTRNYKDFISYYRSVITKYPDNYYAYRAFIRLKHSNNPIFSSYIKPKNIEFPYERSHRFLDKLVTLKDYEILDEYTSGDDFLKSWVLYEKGDVSQAMLLARNAMDELSEKPDKNDMRWRLVYPVMYYDELSSAVDKAGTVLPLMLALTREESFFNPNAMSPVGAKGLMQLMSVTASDIAARKSFGHYDLFDPEQNLLLGNYYYAFIKSQLNGLDVSSIAAYNGGTGAVNQWKQSLNYHDTDSFIEQIPYPETKNYVKKVLRSYWNYIRIYDGNG